MKRIRLNGKSNESTMHIHPFKKFLHALLYLQVRMILMVVVARKEIAQQAEHQAKDSDKWRELESVNSNEMRKTKNHAKR